MQPLWYEWYGMNDRPQPRLILLLEPNPDHAQSIITGFRGSAASREGAIQTEWITITTDDQALDFIYRQGEYTNAPRPDLILLNFSDPNNQALVTVIKENPQLRRIPIIILHSELDPQQILQSYLGKSNCYVLKSFNLEELTAIAQRIESFWLGIVTLPLE
ncbi:MAG: hypothetical protein VKJ24_03035 [Synechococcales bacterium]|nr:hypothetical protein [Synechococcales bacterium]